MRSSCPEARWPCDPLWSLAVNSSRNRHGEGQTWEDRGVSSRIYVIGGGSRGLGRAIAQELVSRGNQVVLVSRDAASLDAAVADLGEAAIACPADVSSPAGADAVAHVVDDHFGGRIGGRKRVV